MADVALAGTVIASHYAVPLARTLKGEATLLAEPRLDAEKLAELRVGATVRILDRRGGWAWGYAGELVGYLPTSAL